LISGRLAGTFENVHLQTGFLQKRDDAGLVVAAVDEHSRLLRHFYVVQLGFSLPN
jgi:hypothetical protein